MQCGHMHRMVPCLAFFVSNNILSLNSNFFQSL
jgi:hypothetical protein